MIKLIALAVIILTFFILTLLGHKDSDEQPSAENKDSKSRVL